MNIGKYLLGLICLVSWANAKELARVNGAVLTDKDLTQSLMGLTEEQRKLILQDPTSRQQLLDDLINREVLAQEAEKLNLDQDHTFKHAIEIYRKQALMNMVLEKKVGPQLTQGAEKKFYEQHKNQFNTDQVHVQQILLSSDAEARKVLKLAQDSKNNFQELAEKYSKDPDVKNTRGELGYVGRDRVDPQFIDLALATDEGKVAGPIHTILGYHIIKVINKKYGKQLGFHEVEFQVRNALRQQLMKNYVENVRHQTNVKVDAAAIEKFHP